MATPSGTIGLSDVNAELGFSPTALISMNDAAVRTLAGVPSGAISMQNLQNKSNRVTSSATISANTSNYTLNTAKAPGYSSGKTDMTLTIGPGVYVSSASTGSYSLTVDTSWNPGDTVTIVNQGVIVGRGGNGAQGSSASFPQQSGFQQPGSPGGPALIVQRATSLNNQNRIAGGGGGGGGGGAAFLADPEGSISQGGGGGGGGIGGSSGGIGGNFQRSPSDGPPAQAGQSGTLTAAGSGGTGSRTNGSPSVPGGTGGNGGGYGSSGSAGGNGSPPNPNFWAPGRPGGSAGAAIAGNSNITYINTGTINGSVS